MFEFFCGESTGCQATMYLATVFAVVCAVSGLVLLVHAFKDGPVHGILGLLFPPYLLYYGFARFKHGRKGLILTGWLGSFIVAGVLAGWVSTALFGPDITQQQPMDPDLGRTSKGGTGSGAEGELEASSDFEGDLGADFEGDLGVDTGGDASTK